MSFPYQKSDHFSLDICSPPGNRAPEPEGFFDIQFDSA